MTCEEMFALLERVANGEVLSEETLQKIDQHMTTCPRCLKAAGKIFDDILKLGDSDEEEMK